MGPLYLGIDVGTSGVRVAVIDEEGTSVAGRAVAMEAPQMVDGRPTQDPDIWWQAVSDCLDGLAASLSAAGRSMGDIAALAVDGTSGTMLLADPSLEPLSPGLMYNAGGFAAESDRIAAIAPAGSIVQGPSSALARLLFLLREHSPPPDAHLCHQADWIAGRLMGRAGLSDETNALKTGYDPRDGAWPDWFDAFGFAPGLLPEVRPVGALQGRVDAAMASRFGFSAATQVMAGTTDSVAAFLATGADQIGDAVTSLGTTLAVKLLCDRPISDAATGVYSHKVGSMWLVGGASNSGGGVLLAHFSPPDLDRMTPLLKPDMPTGLDYYPLKSAGERFPINDPALPPRLEPRPDDDVIFFQAMLEGMAAIEARGYRALATLGGPAPRRIFTAGGGGRNDAWTRIRQQHFNCPIVSASHTDAAIGAARVAARMSGSSGLR